jgi:hypothetical protein
MDGALWVLSRSRFKLLCVVVSTFQTMDAAAFQGSKASSLWYRMMIE